MTPTPHVRTDYRFAPIPEDLIYDRTISALALRVYATLMRHGLDPASCYPSHARIADLVGVSPRSVHRPLKDLETAGWIDKVKRLNDRQERMTDAYFVNTTPRTGARATALRLPTDHRQKQVKPSALRLPTKENLKPKENKAQAAARLSAAPENENTPPATPAERAALARQIRATRDSLRPDKKQAS